MRSRPHDHVVDHVPGRARRDGSRRRGVLGAASLVGALVLAGPAGAQGLTRTLSTTLGSATSAATGPTSAVVNPAAAAVTTPVGTAVTNAATNAAINPATGAATGAVGALGGMASLRGTVDAAGALAGNVVQVVPTTLSGNTANVSALNGSLLSGSALNGNSTLSGNSALNGTSALNGSLLNGVSALNGSLDGNLSGNSVLDGNGATQTTSTQTTSTQATNAPTTTTNTQVANDVRANGPGGGTTRGAGNPVQIVNVAAGTRADAAVNLAQLNDALAGLPLRGTNTSSLAVSVASGADALAVGYGAQAGGGTSLAVGTNAAAGGTDAVAIGANASANQANAVAIGAGARTTRAGQVAVGTAASTYTLAGLPSDASRAAQSGPTQFVTTDGNGNLAGSGYGPSSIATLSNRVDTIGQYAAETRREAREGVATALAMPTASMPSAPGRTSWVANSATYRGAWAGGVALAHRLPTPVPLALMVGYAYGGDGSHGVRAGLGGEF